MRKAKLNFVVDAIALIAFVFLASTGILIHYVLPPGSGHSSTLWNMDRHQWGDLHFWAAVVLIGLIVVHLFLHWRWVLGIVKGKVQAASGKRLTFATVCLVLLTGAAIAPFFAAVEQKPGDSPHKGRGENHAAAGEGNQANGSAESHDEEIKGSMTLAEIEQMTGVAVAVILDELKLPADTPVGSRLGPLRRQYEFEMNDVREAVRKHRASQ